MHVVVTAATAAEWAPALQALQQSGLPAAASETEGISLAGLPAETFMLRAPGPFGLRTPLRISFHQSGVGMLATAFSLSKLIWGQRPDLIIQAGIAGTFDTQCPLSKVFVVDNEYLGDTGVLENNVWRDLFDLKLEGADNAPFQNKALPNPWLPAYNLLQLPIVDGVTVNAISTDPGQIARLTEKYKPVLESMEGAVLHYICRETHTPFLQLRAVSNYVGVRDKKQWSIGPAIAILNETLLELIKRMDEEREDS
ncbi:futalosine hydrolase [Filimonas effusa]|uniref:Futalosine hydrolase n=1 Tax=Filimonas effusa TaxID=2508721 RepID=A0A4V1M9J7_9BACT|nr:futalosine hydrolase [Filimonas effusa]RXK81388.1 futalosine hydrolase [Filimonas effusa]